MTFDEVLKAVRETEPLEHFTSRFGMTFFAEGYRNGKLVFSLVMKHTAKGYETWERGFLVAFGGVDDDAPQLINLTADQFYQLREAINLNCNPWTENER